MKINLSLTLLLITLFISGFNNKRSSLLYQIKGENLKTSYLFGTIHAMPDKGFTLPEKVRRSLDECDLLVLEVDMDEEDFETQLLEFVFDKKK